MTNGLYINEKKSLELNQVKAMLEDMAKKDKLHYDEYYLNEAAKNIIALNDALINDRAVFMVSNKETNAKSYFTLHYVDESGNVQMFWMYSLNALCWMRMTDRLFRHGLRAWHFVSDAIGMSRTLDSMQGLHWMFTCLGGTVFQITQTLN